MWLILTCKYQAAAVFVFVFLVFFYNVSLLIIIRLFRFIYLLWAEPFWYVVLVSSVCKNVSMTVFWWRFILVNPYSLLVKNTSSFFSIILGGYGHIGKWIQENIIFMRFCCFKLSKKFEKLSNEQLAQAITKCTLTGLVQQAKESCWKWNLKSHKPI